MSAGNGSSSIVVVEIDTRKGPIRTVFESSIENQTEQAKQFWKTLNLSPHIESSLYSKEILQQIRSNPLRPMMIDNSRKVPQPDPKTESYLHNVQVLNQIDEIVKLQKKAAKIENIKHMHKTKRTNNKQKQDPDFKSTNQINAIVAPTIENNGNDTINEDDYEIDPNDSNDEELVKYLD